MRTTVSQLRYVEQLISTAVGRPLILNFRCLRCNLQVTLLQKTRNIRIFALWILMSRQIIRNNVCPIYAPAGVTRRFRNNYSPMAPVSWFSFGLSWFNFTPMHKIIITPLRTTTGWFQSTVRVKMLGRFFKRFISSEWKGTRASELSVSSYGATSMQFVNVADCLGADDRYYVEKTYNKPRTEFQSLDSTEKINR